MDDNIQYSEKEIAIFKGIISLTQQGVNPYNIKVSDIAQSADVGKGTIYDYFSSKEEAISKAIIYNISNEVRSMYLGIMSKESFREKFYEILDMMINQSENSLSIPNVLLDTGGFNKFYEYIVDDKGGLLELISRVNDIAMDLLKIGFDEGVISIKESEYYQIMSFKCSISGFLHYLNTKDLYKDISIEEAKDLSYKLFLKALN